MRMRGLVSALLVIPLGACAASGGGAGQAATESHTMADGTVMEGGRHVHDDSHSHEDGHSHEDPPGGSAAVGPSEAARMVCTGQVVDDVTRIMGLEDPVEPESSWSKPTFTCTFSLPAGPLVLSVHDAPDTTVGEAHFRGLRASRSDDVPIKGVYSLGLPAYETAGTVAFVKDGKTLEVDATALTGRLGSQQDMSRSEIAYAVATSVLACWTQHG